MSGASLLPEMQSVTKITWIMGVNRVRQLILNAYTIEKNVINIKILLYAHKWIWKFDPIDLVPTILYVPTPAP